MVPALPYDIWLKIMTTAAARARIEWWNKLSEIEQEYMEWPLEDEEVAEGEVEMLFYGDYFFLW